MSREVIVRIRDDVAPELDAEETIEDLCIDGVRYVLDLTHEHAAELRSGLQPWLDAAHEQFKLPKQQLLGLPERKAPVATRKTIRSECDENRRIRDWARQNGHEVNDRGVIPHDVRAAYLRWMPSHQVIEGEVVEQMALPMAPRKSPRHVEAGRKGGKTRAANLAIQAQAHGTKEYPDLVWVNAHREEIREWGLANGHHVAPRGNLPRRVVEDFWAEHQHRVSA